MKLLLLSVYDSNVNINKCCAPVICLQSRIVQWLSFVQKVLFTFLTSTIPFTIQYRTKNT